MLLTRLRDALSWRWRLAAGNRFLRATFENGDELARSLADGSPCDRAVGRDGAVIRHPAGRTGLARMILEVWFHRVYTRPFYRPRAGDVVIDAGANVGLFSLWLARRRAGCRVLAFEPFAENYRLLCENLHAARAAGVTAYRAGLAGAAGSYVMADGGARSQDHRLTAAPAGGAGDTTPTHTLADTLALSGADEVALFKCDIEGSEHDLFARADPADLARVRRFALEYHDNIRPGTLALLRDRLGGTHRVVVRPDGEAGYGMLYATRRRA